MTPPGEARITGALLRALRQEAGLERSTIAAAMSPSVGRQRVVNLEMQAYVSVEAARRYMNALAKLRQGHVGPPGE
jgi:lambda repressor-like predicted transcriptional regulator